VRDPDAGETYDLVVVGAGMSGLAAAYYFIKNVGRGAKVLILDNHDAFGGHAKSKLGPNLPASSNKAGRQSCRRRAVHSPGSLGKLRGYQPFPVA
jgi:cation diffusion facilitator CzcD-associated flavoprotein CzcO